MTAAAASIDPAQLTLRPRPEPDPAVLAAIASAVQMAWPRPPEPDSRQQVTNAWRFSGRWWNKPVPVSRDRPWSRR